jgi:nucleoside-diphosphate-sugar epimerase
MSELHVIFGTGPLGLATMKVLHAQGKNIRLVNRSGHRTEAVPDDVEVIAGDASRADFTSEVTKTAVVVYQCAQPKYHEWVEKFPPLQAAILEGAAANGAKLIVAENTYMYGDPQGKPITEDHPYNAHTRKGKVRKEMTESLMKAHQSGKVRVVIARGSDFFGPSTVDSTVGERVFGNAMKGKTAQFVGNLDIPHTQTYIHDFGQALVILAEQEHAFGQTWHVPSDQPAITQREFGKMIFQELDLPAKISGMSKTMMWFGGWFIPEAKESVEMMYEFEKPFILDHSKFEKAFGNIATTLDESIKATVDWYRTGFSKGES